MQRRCRHVVTECRRTLESTEALRRGELDRFGALMNGSHDSLRDDYEVSCPEIDLLVSLARRVPGVKGARITGGGFGGCTVNLVHREAVEGLKREVLVAYEKQVGIKPKLFITKAADGAAVSLKEVESKRKKLWGLLLSSESVRDATHQSQEVGEAPVAVLESLRNTGGQGRLRHRASPPAPRRRAGRCRPPQEHQAEVVRSAELA